jgi:hypothetical protein
MPGWGTAGRPPPLVSTGGYGSPRGRRALEALLVVPERRRRSDLDRLRPPFSPTITGLVQALQRLVEVRALGVGELDLSALPARRVTNLARYAEDAWAIQLAALARAGGPPPWSPSPTCSPPAPATTSSTSSAWSSATFSARPPAAVSRAGELRNYDRAVGELQARLQSVLDALDDAAIATVLAALRADPEKVNRALSTVVTLMRPPEDPVTSAWWPPTRRFAASCRS